MKISLLAGALGLGMVQASIELEQERTTEPESSRKQNLVGRIMDDMKESTRNIHAINKANSAAIKYAFWEMHTAVTEPHQGIVKVKEAEGFKNKIIAIGMGIKQSAQEQSEKEKVRHEQIKSHESYKNLMQQVREQRVTQ